MYSLIFRIVRYKSRVGLYRRERGAEICIFVGGQRRKVEQREGRNRGGGEKKGERWDENE